MMRLLLTALMCSVGFAHAHDPQATYIANEGVLVENGETKIMFDPLFSEGFGNYLTVPDETRAKMMAGEAPFDGVDAIFISHAHGDHFAAKEVADYLEAQPDVHLFAPQQAVDRLMLAISQAADVKGRVHAFKLAEGDPPITKSIEGVTAEAVRIPHAGGRPHIENTVFRVTLNDEIAVMHMGDANGDIKTYEPHALHWQAVETDTGFPPYWLLTMRGGPEILNFMNIRENVGTHVPIKVPRDLKRSGADYFSKPGERRVIGERHGHD